MVQCVGANQFADKRPVEIAVTAIIVAQIQDEVAVSTVRHALPELPAEVLQTLCIAVTNLVDLRIDQVEVINSGVPVRRIDILQPEGSFCGLQA